MNIDRNQPSPGNLWKWFNPLGRQLSFSGFSLNRITALGLTLYLYLHLLVLSQLAVGPNAYGNFLKIIHSPMFVFGEWLVVAAGLIHGLNGLRIGLTSLGIVVPQQKQIFVGLMVIAVIGSLIFAFRMFTTL
jgi:succinate dehydrogenase / fumarate reductase cytochrome b subunit